MFTREWLASGRGAAMFFALLFSLLAPAPAVAQAKDTDRGYEQLRFQQDAFVQNAGALLFKKASRPSKIPAILANGTVVSSQLSAHPFEIAAVQCPHIRASASAAPYLARAPPAAA